MYLYIESRYPCVHVFMHLCIFGSVDLFVYACMRIARMRVCECVHIRMCVSVYVCICVCVYVCMCVFVYVCTYMHVCMNE